MSSESLYIPLAFFFGFVDEDLDPFGAALDPIVVASEVVASEVVASDVVVLDPFLAPFFELFVLSCAARIAKSSSLLEQPVASKILLMVGEVSSSIVAREVFEALDVVALVDERET